MAFKVSKDVVYATTAIAIALAIIVFALIGRWSASTKSAGAVWGTSVVLALVLLAVGIVPIIGLKTDTSTDTSSNGGRSGSVTELKAYLACSQKEVYQGEALEYTLSFNEPVKTLPLGSDFSPDPATSVTLVSPTTALVTVNPSQVTGAYAFTLRGLSHVTAVSGHRLKAAVASGNDPKVLKPISLTGQLTSKQQRIQFGSSVSFLLEFGQDIVTPPDAVDFTPTADSVVRSGTKSFTVNFTPSKAGDFVPVLKAGGAVRDDASLANTSPIVASTTVAVVPTTTLTVSWDNQPGVPASGVTGDTFGFELAFSHAVVDFRPEAYMVSADASYKVAGIEELVKDQRYRVTLLAVSTTTGVDPILTLPVDLSDGFQTIPAGPVPRATSQLVASAPPAIEPYGVYGQPFDWGSSGLRVSPFVDNSPAADPINLEGYLVSCGVDQTKNSFNFTLGHVVAARDEAVWGGSLASLGRGAHDGQITALRAVSTDIGIAFGGANAGTEARKDGSLIAAYYTDATAVYECYRGALQYYNSSHIVFDLSDEALDHADSCARRNEAISKLQSEFKDTGLPLEVHVAVPSLSSDAQAALKAMITKGLDISGFILNTHDLGALQQLHAFLLANLPGSPTAAQVWGLISAAPSKADTTPSQFQTLVAGLVSNSAHSIAFRTVNDDDVDYQFGQDCSNYGPLSIIEPIKAPGAPATLHVPAYTETIVYISWTPGANCLGYILYRDGVIKARTGPKGGIYLFDNSSMDKTRQYSFTVAGVGVDGTVSAQSAGFGVETQYAIMSPGVSNLAAGAVTDFSVELKWDLLSFDEQVAQMSLDRGSTSLSKQLPQRTERYLDVDQNLAAATSYTYKVTSVVPDGKTSETKSVTVKTLAKPTNVDPWARNVVYAVGDRVRLSSSDGDSDFVSLVAGNIGNYPATHVDRHWRRVGDPYMGIAWEEGVGGVWPWDAVVLRGSTRYQARWRTSTAPPSNSWAIVA